MSVTWVDTPGFTATLKVSFSALPSQSCNASEATWSALILSVKDQAFSSSNSPANVDYCNTKTVSITVPHMWVQGTGGIAQPPLQEVVYSWTLPPGWYADGNITNTYINGITIHPTACAVPGTVQVVGSINYTCGSAGVSAPLNISLSGYSPTATITVPQGYLGSTACNTTPVTFTALVNPSLGCVQSYNWYQYPAGWTLVSQSNNTATFRPSGNSSDSDPNSPFKVKVNFTCGSTIISGGYNPAFILPVITGLSPICSSAQYSISNAPGATASWSSSNPSGLGINATTGLATCVGDFSGQVTITAIVCSTTIQQNVYVGLPAADIYTFIYVAGKRGTNPVTLSCSSTYRFQCDPVAGASSYNWVLPTGFSFYSANTTSSPTINTPYNTGYYNLTCAAVNACGQSYTRSLGINISTGGGGGALAVALNTFPNPATSYMTVQLTDSLMPNPSEGLMQPYQFSLFDRLGNAVYSIQSDQCILQVPVHSLPQGIYYINVKYKDAVLRKQIVITP